MTSRDLTGEQFDRLIHTANKQLAYYLRAWQRVQANDMPLDDPLAVGICDTWNAVLRWRDGLVRLRDALPKLYRPLASPEKRSGLAVRTQPWAERQRQAAEDVARHAERPTPPDPARVTAQPPARPAVLPPTTDVFAATAPSRDESERMQAEFQERRREGAKHWPGRGRSGRRR